MWTTFYPLGEHIFFFACLSDVDVSHYRQRKEASIMVMCSAVTLSGSVSLLSSVKGPGLAL